jgi:hypothetical protein
VDPKANRDIPAVLFPAHVSLVALDALHTYFCPGSSEQPAPLNPARSLRKLERRNMTLADSHRWVLKREYYRGMVAAGPCAELQQLKQQYESALRIWGEYQFPVHNAPVGTQLRRFEQFKQRALDERNAANNRLLEHKLTCPLCAPKRNIHAI